MELFKTVAEKAGISVEQAKTAVETVLESLKEKLPSGVSDQLENLLGGDSFDLGKFTSSLGDKAKDLLGGIFGK